MSVFYIINLFKEENIMKTNKILRNNNLNTDNNLFDIGVTSRTGYYIILRPQQKQHPNYLSCGIFPRVK